MCATLEPEELEFLKLLRDTDYRADPSEYLVRMLIAKFPKRFALSTLLLAMLIVAVVLGFVEWRRQRLIKEVEDLNSIGAATFSIAEETHQLATFNAIESTGGWWETALPQPTVVNVKIDDFGKSVIVGGRKYPVAEAKEVVAQLRRRLNRVGVADVTIHVTGAIYNYEVAEQLEAAE